VRLAGKTSDHNVNCGETAYWPRSSLTVGVGHFSVNGADVGIARYLRPVLGEHGPTPRIDLDLPLHLEPGAREAEIKAANAREQRSDRHHRIGSSV
jgi:hypothetical protein